MDRRFVPHRKFNCDWLFY